jgi:hypothetical protein
MPHVRFSLPIFHKNHCDGSDPGSWRVDVRSTPLLACENDYLSFLALFRCLLVDRVSQCKHLGRDIAEGWVNTGEALCCVLVDPNQLFGTAFCGDES